MGSRGRFGKYGDMKRKERLRQARIDNHHPGKQPPSSFPKRPSPKMGRPREAPIHIRPAAATDARFIGRLSAKVFSIFGPYEDCIPQWFLLETTRTLIALQGNKPSGFVMAGCLSDGWNHDSRCEVLAIAVEPQKRRMGIGSRLLKEIENSMAGPNKKDLFLHTGLENHEAQRLFLRHGYCVCGIKKNFYPAGQDAVLMSKEI